MEGMQPEIKNHADITCQDIFGKHLAEGCIFGNMGEEEIHSLRQRGNTR